MSATCLAPGTWPSPGGRRLARHARPRWRSAARGDVPGAWHVRDIAHGWRRNGRPPAMSLW